MIKGSIQKEQIKFVNLYAPNIGVPQYIRKKLTAINREIDSNTVVKSNFNVPLSSRDRSCRQKITKENIGLK